jgi:hypothetical protein
MGFRTSRQAEMPPSMLIIARSKINGTGAAIKNIAGADAMLLSAKEPGMTPSVLLKIAKNLKDTPWGVYLDECTDEAAKLVEAGCDFLVFSPSSPVAATPTEEKTGKILQVESSMDDGLLRAVNNLPADAVLLTDTSEENTPLVWHQLMIFRHLTAFISKPLLVPALSTISEAELKALWDAGIDGVVIDAAGNADLKELKQMAGKLPPRSARKQGKMDVILPRTGGEKRTAPPPDEEEEEDE